MLGTALTLQAMAIVGMAWVLVAWSRTTLTIEDDGQWRRWYVHAGAHDEAVRDFRARLSPGAWLEGADRTRHLLRTVLPLLLVAVGAGGLVLVTVLELLNRALRLP